MRYEEISLDELIERGWDPEDPRQAWQLHSIENDN